jgi:hypothetical protein
MWKVYRIAASADAETALERIKDLLTAEGVKFKQIDLQLKSTRTPIAILSIQPVLYTRRNWVGLNPFIFISKIVINAKQSNNTDVVLEILINRLRAYILAIFLSILGYFVGRAMPQPAGALLFVGVVFTGWFGFVSFLGGYLVRSEIARAVRS